jgi:hypothetical protein
MTPIPPPRNDKESKDIVKRLNDLAMSSDVSRINDIQDFQNTHNRYMSVNYRPYMNQFEMYFCALDVYSRSVNYLEKKDWPKNRGFQFIIATHALKQFYSSYILLNSGFYGDSLTVLRSVYESFVRILFISCHPEAPANVYKAKGQVRPSFNASGLMNDELKLNWTKYNILSVFAHSNMYVVMEDMIEIGINKKQKPVHLDYKKDDDMIGATSNFILFLLSAFLKLYDELFVVDISGRKDKVHIQVHIDLLNQYSSIAHESLLGHTESEYWRKASVDLANLLELMKSMDDKPSQNFKEVWKTINN